MTSEVLTTVTMKSIVSWAVMPSSLVLVCTRIRSNVLRPSSCYPEDAFRKVPGMQDHPRRRHVHWLPPTEMSSRNLPGGKERSPRNVRNLTAICEQIVYKMRQPRRLTILWTSMVCYFFVPVQLLRESGNSRQ
jgi:hypothetical protein